MAEERHPMEFRWGHPSRVIGPSEHAAALCGLAALPSCDERGNVLAIVETTEGQGRQR